MKRVGHVAAQRRRNAYKTLLVRQVHSKIQFVGKMILEK
jgi:hypothetical protein